jgi:hypothetical protein
MILNSKCLTFQTNEIPELPYLPTQNNDFGIKIYVFGALSTIQRINWNLRNSV